MKAGTNKVLLPILGKPMIRYQVEALRAAGIEKVFMIVGFQAEQVKAELGKEADYVLQAEQKGTGHALIQARKKLLSLGPGLDVVVTVGDNPYITAEILKDLIRVHRRTEAAATIVVDLGGMGKRKCSEKRCAPAVGFYHSQGFAQAFLQRKGLCHDEEKGAGYS